MDLVVLKKAGGLLTIATTHRLTSQGAPLRTLAHAAAWASAKAKERRWAPADLSSQRLADRDDCIALLRVEGDNATVCPRRPLANIEVAELIAAGFTVENL